MKQSLVLLLLGIVAAVGASDRRAFRQGSKVSQRASPPPPPKLMKHNAVPADKAAQRAPPPPPPPTLQRHNAVDGSTYVSPMDKSTCERGFQRGYRAGFYEFVEHFVKEISHKDKDLPDGNLEAYEEGLEPSAKDALGEATMELRLTLASISAAGKTEADTREGRDGLMAERLTEELKTQDCSGRAKAMVEEDFNKMFHNGAQQGFVDAQNIVTTNMSDGVEKDLEDELKSTSKKLAKLQPALEAAKKGVVGYFKGLAGMHKQADAAVKELIARKSDIGDVLGELSKIRMGCFSWLLSDNSLDVKAEFAKAKGRYAKGLEFDLADADESKH